MSRVRGQTYMSPLHCFMWLHQHECVSSKTRLKSKITWNQVCPCKTFTLTILLYQQRISHLHVVMKKIYNFPKKSELPMFILPVKISWLIFLRFLGWKWKLCRDQSRLTFSSRGLAAWFCARGYAVCACASILACTPMWACSLVRYAQINVYCII